ncbi:MAG: response regulator [Bacteroidetes bacterium]|nr:response regulator [Bacteroidota bacterium]MCB0842904.1 response regulator [Bacteroidota bacterium]MCB0852694.1 response regulator [Bacteroidota bacterium]
MINKKKLILIVDDDDNIRMLLEFVLRKYYKIVTREDGLSATSWLMAGNFPDLIIADLEMPRLNGYHFLKNIRESGFFHDIPLVMLSGYESNEIKQKCLQQGADDYWIKPFNPADMLQKIEILTEKPHQLSRKH